MLRFDSKFLQALENLGILFLLYKHYVDDIEVICPPLKAGWYYSKEAKALKYNPDHESSQLPPDQRTMVMLRDLADTLDPNLTFTFDCPSLNANGRMPILDIQVWVQGTQIRHTFFGKPCAPNSVIDSRSAVFTRTKRNTPFSEA